MTEQLKLKICIPDGIISDFCYPFLKALINKLKELEKEDRIFKYGLSKALSKEPQNSELTEIARITLEKIIIQIECSGIGGQTTPSEIKEVIKSSEEFLAIFEIK